MFKITRASFKSLKISIAFMVIMMTLMLALMSYVIAAFYSQQVLTSLVLRLESDINDRVDVELNRFFDNAERVTLINYAMMKDGVIEENRPELVGRQLLNMIKIDSSVDYAYYANNEGGAIIAGHELSGYSLYTTRDNKAGPFDIKLYDEYGLLQKETTKGEGYFDARTRSWYKNAFLTPGVFWSDIYIWAQEPTLGITVSKAYYKHDGSKAGVFASDVKLSKISDFLRKLYISPNGIMYLVQDSGLLVASTTGDTPYHYSGNVQNRVYARSSSNPLIRATQISLEKEMGAVSSVKSLSIRKIKIGGADEYVLVQPYTFKNMVWYKVLVLPVSDFNSQVAEFTQKYVLLVLIFLMISLFVGIYMARRISKPIQAITEAAEKLAAGRYDYRLDSGRSDEIGRLEKSFNKMADDLKQLLESLGNKNHELIAFNQKLERMVMERTKDLEIKAMTDEMTGIANHKSLMDKLSDLYKRKKTSGGTFSIALIDLDYFKKVNDTHGHLVGDQILKAFSELIREAIREGDFFGRYGGEEFLIIFPGAPLGEVVGVCERLRLAVAQYHFLEQGLSLTASFGVAEWTGEKIPDLIHRADMNLYEAKRAGRNRVQA